MEPPDPIPDLELMAWHIQTAVNSYIEAANKDPEAHAHEWDNLMDTGVKLNQFLIRTRPRRVA